MANVLTGKIVIDNSGVSKAFNDVSLRLKDQRAILKSLQLEYAKLSTAQLSSPFGKELAADIRIANAEVKRLEAGAVPALGNIGDAATKGFSALRQFAYIIPGIGIAGLIGGLSEMVVGLFNSAGAFDKASLAAEIFKDKLDDVKAASERLEGFLQLQNKISDLKFRIAGGEGAGADIANFKNQLASTNTVIKDATTNLNKFNETEQDLIKGIIDISSTLGKFDQKNPLVELAMSGKDLTKITKEEADKMPAALKPLVNAFIENRKAIIDEDKRLTQATGEQSILRLQIQKTEADESRRIRKESFQELLKRQFDLGQAGGRVRFTLAGTAAIDLSRVKIELLGEKKLTFAEQVGKNIEKGLEALVIKPNLNISTKGVFSKEKIAEIKGLANMIQDTLTPAFQSFFDTVAGGGNAFKAFANAAGQALIALIEKLAIAAVLSLILSSITGGGAAIGAASGSFKDIFKFLTGFGGAKAGGGPVNSGRGYLVGENGPEFFRPNTGGTIVPNNQLGASMGNSGGMRVEIVGNTIIRGMDLIQVLTIANQSKSRLI